MTKETIFRATDPDGGHHYRGSVSRTYSHAILRKFDGKWEAVAFASRPDLAEKEAGSFRRATSLYVNSKDVTPERRSLYAAAIIITAPCIVVEKRGG